MAFLSIFKPQPKHYKSEAPTPVAGKLLRVSIRNREKVIFDGDALALSSVNTEGAFDVLPQHINFISIIKEYITIYKPDKTKQEYKLRVGLMKVNGNKIEIFVGIAPQIPTQQKK
jgi:F0F1-type ATP synthase epsilon subunit